MILIASSSSLNTEWALADGEEILEKAVTSGLNPFFHTRREISHIIRLELPELFFKTKLEKVIFYGSGCEVEDKIKTLKASLVAQFHTSVEVNSDLLGGARSMLQNQAGLVAILSTGSNSCSYDGTKILKNILPGGYILGDEGSSSYMGKLLLSDILKELVAPHIISKFYDDFRTTQSQIIDLIYSTSSPLNILSEFSTFLSNHMELDYCRKLVYDSFLTFFRRNITGYDYENYPLCVVGTTACTYRSLLELAAEEFGVNIKRIEPSLIDGLVKFHSLL